MIENNLVNKIPQIYYIYINVLSPILLTGSPEVVKYIKSDILYDLT